VFPERFHRGEESEVNILKTAELASKLQALVSKDQRKQEFL
jgi:hypothetical protein